MNNLIYQKPAASAVMLHYIKRILVGGKMNLIKMTVIRVFGLKVATFLYFVNYFS